MPKDDVAVVARMKYLALEYRRYGCPRLHAMLRLEGLVVNKKTTYRLYIAQDLQVHSRTETIVSSVLGLFWSNSETG